jgi:transposase
MKTFEELNEAEKLSIKRRKQKGTSLSEISEIIGCSVFTIKKVLNNGVLKGNTK